MKTAEILKKSFSENKAVHAYVIEAKREIIYKLLLECAKTALCDLHGCDECAVCKKIADGQHSDVIYLPRDKIKNRITVDDIAYLADESYKLPADGKKRAFILNAADSVTGSGAEVWQNKLLKTLEEPLQGVYIFVAVSDKQSLLPTVLSRCQVLSEPKMTMLEVKSELLNLGFSDEPSEVAAAYADGDVEAAKRLLADNSLFSDFQIAADFLGSGATTKNVLPYVSEFTARKNNAARILFALELLLTESVYKKICPELCRLPSFEKALEKIRFDYSVNAALNCVPLIERAKARLDNNGNYTTVLDNLIADMLEVKYRCR